MARRKSRQDTRICAAQRRIKDYIFIWQVRFPDGEVEHNYCRNPLGQRPRPWCHSSAPGVDWEYCNIPTCGKEHFTLY